MASAPKRRRVRKSHQQANSTTQPNQTDDISQLVETCMAAAMPIVQETVRQCILNSRQNDTSQEAATSDPGISTLVDITSAGTSSVDLHTPTPALTNPGISRPVGLGVDPKITAKIFANEYVKLVSLLPKNAWDQEPKFKTVEQDGQLIFVKTNDQAKIKTLSQWTEAFHVFVAIYCQKHPEDVGHLMTYAQIVQGIAKSCGDESAIDYDEKFRQWRQVAPQACPWNLKNMELFQDAMITSLDTKSKFKKQPFRANSGKQKYCFSYNNKGSCNKANSCTYAHICQYCAGRHPRLQCSKNRSNFSNISQPKSVLPDSSKKQPTHPK